MRYVIIRNYPLTDSPGFLFFHSTVPRLERGALRVSVIKLQVGSMERDLGNKSRTRWTAETADIDAERKAVPRERYSGLVANSRRDLRCVLLRPLDDGRNNLLRRDDNMAPLRCRDAS